MARLNDVTASAESIEALKRRFVRQNREIARVNSLQSLRIRSLESEISHLLAENVSLREQVINLTNDIDRLEAAKSLSNGVYEIKSRLDAKLAELSGLANDLGMLPRKVGKLDGDKEGTGFDRPKATAPESKSRSTDLEGQLDVGDGRLPAILEDKSYPRRTLESREIQNLADIDSSVLESPPGTQQSMDNRFDIGVESPTPKGSEDRPESRVDGATSPDPFFPPTLETRKRKKKPVESTDPIPEDAPRGEPSPKKETSKPRNSGSKRKFSPDDDGFMSDPLPEDDEFQFSRPNHSPRKQTEPVGTVRQEPLPSKTPVSSEPGSLKPASMKRKVLEPKSANANMGSPKKARSLHPDSKVLSHAGGNENNLPLQGPKDLLSHKPKRPSQATRGSRTSSDSLKAKRSSRSIGVEELTQGSPIAQSDEALAGDFDAAAAIRPSRRRGAVVSYAEPNLRAKMRRPTKDMIDAVANQEARRSSSFQLLQDGLSDESDRNSGGKSGHSPRARSSGNMPADFALADQATEISGHRLTSVSQRRRKTSSTSKADDRPFIDDGDYAGPEPGSNPKQTTRRQPRRHSSNPKSNAGKASSVYGVDISGQSLSPPGATSPINVASLLQSAVEDEDAGWKDSTAMDAGLQRETRVASRRRSMMV